MSRAYGDWQIMERTTVPPPPQPVTPGVAAGTVKLYGVSALFLQDNTLR
jgi:hypothetical protein